MPKFSKEIETILSLSNCLLTQGYKVFVFERRRSVELSGCIEFTQ